MAEASGDASDGGGGGGGGGAAFCSEPSPNKQQQPHSSSGFDCNICLELAQEPVVTLCGHLFCWPCLYRWLHGHSTCQECPVCKALVQEEKLIPLYSRGNPNNTDPRKKPPPFTPQASRPPDPHNAFYRPHYGFNFMAPAARFGSFSFFAGCGLLPSLLGPHFHGFPDPEGLGAGHMFGFPMGFHGANSPLNVNGDPEAWLYKLFMVLGILVMIYFVFF